MQSISHTHTPQGGNNVDIIAMCHPEPIILCSISIPQTALHHEEARYMQISLCPVCVGNGDAIFVTIDKNGKIPTIFTLTKLILTPFILKTDGGKECYE